MIPPIFVGERNRSTKADTGGTHETKRRSSRIIGLNFSADCFHRTRYNQEHISFFSEKITGIISASDLMTKSPLKWVTKSCSCNALSLLNQIVVISLFSCVALS